MFSDFKFIVLWWLVIFLLSTTTLPLVFYFFGRFFDRGYIFSKVIATVLATYLIFILGVFHILPFTIGSLLFVILFIASINYFFIARHQKFRQLIKNHYRIFLFEEITFFIVLSLWSFIRGFAPDIEGLEKFMDWGFVNSALRGTFLPPADMWFAGSPINYYYFGHLVFALITKLSVINSTISYNLSIATICGLTFVGTFSLSANLVYQLQKKLNRFVIVGGLISALLLTFGGNLHPIYKIAKINIQNNGHLLLTRDAIASAASSYWYPDATRFIGFDPDIKDKTIHEFPLYSFVVADLHGHLNDVPVILFFIALILSFVLSPSSSSKFRWSMIVPTALTLSIAYMTNAWDFAVYGLLWAVIYFLVYLSRRGFWPAFSSTLYHGILIVIFWYLFTLPYSLNFTPMAEGLRLADSHSPFYQLFILYGGFWLITLPFVIFIIKKLSTKSRLLATDFFVFALILVATLLIIIPEIGYIKDIYIFEHRRANTMFKLVYEAFILYSLVSGYILIRFHHSIYKFLFVFVFIIHLIYPYFAIKSYYGLTKYKGLYGLNWLRDRYPDNFLAINWINQNISGQPLMLEAVGDSYTDYNQVSSATGLPTIEGWVVHEWLWRGGYDQPSTRQTDVTKIYESKDLSEVRSLLQKYSVDYVFIGDKEVEKYPNLNLSNFDQLGSVVAQFGSTKIYRLNK